MSLSFGLNVHPAGSGSNKQQLKSTRVSLGDADDDEGLDALGAEPPDDRKPAFEEIDDLSTLSNRPSRLAKSPARRQVPKSSGPPTLKTRSGASNSFADLSSNRISHKSASTATSLDPTIYDYDAYHTAASSIQSARKAAAQQDATERKPKYMNNLLDAAARRKQDQLVAREKVLQREREQEGDEFADKEKFVTAAYKAQQEEARKLEAEEARKREMEEARRRKMGASGLSGFYKTVLEAEDARAKDARTTTEMLESGTLPLSVPASADDYDPAIKTDQQLAAEMRAKGVEVLVNDDGQVADKRQLLNAGLNVSRKPSSGGPGITGAAEIGSHEPRAARSGWDKGQSRERQTRMMEEQLETARKRAAEEEAEQARAVAAAAKSRKTEGDISDARARYLARKAEAAAAAAAAAGKSR